MGVPKYDQSIMKSDEGQLLYSWWIAIHKSPCCELFKDFMRFYEWANASGYVAGNRLRRKDEREPYSPENCYWLSNEKTWGNDSCLARAWAKKWNETVNRIRKAYGMPPFEEQAQQEEGQEDG